MDTVLIILTIIAILIGIGGCILPVIPGIPLGFAAILLYAWYDGFTHITVNHLIILAVLTIISVVSDYVLIALSSRLSGSSKYSAIGATVGTILGIFIIPPLGIIIFCLLGAYLTELYFNKDSNKAIKAALGSVVGLFSGMVFKVILGVIMLVFFIAKAI